MARWGYSRIKIWLDFSGDGAWPLQRADEGGGLKSIVELLLITEPREAAKRTGNRSMRRASKDGGAHGEPEMQQSNSVR